MKKWLAGILLTALLLSRPEGAANAARVALSQWYETVAPSLFPFMALLPLLTCREALEIYEVLLGPLTRRLLRLPGAAASALAVGLMAGSPAGCLAARRVDGLDRGQLERLAAACGGLSPAFVISGVGAGMLGSAAAGHMLLRSQLCAQFLLLLLPGRGGGTVEALPPREAAEAPIRAAILAILSVGGYMALFAAVAGALGEFVGPAVGRGILCALDVTSGARIVAGLDLPDAVRLPLLSALVTLGGGCVLAQNLSAISGCGVRAPVFFARRALAATLAALLTRLQMVRNWEIIVSFSPDPMKLACFAAAILAIPVILRLKKTIF